MAEGMRHENTPRTAVVLVHGMGSQKPRETLRALAEALWVTDPGVNEADASQTWFKPTVYADLFDLSSITTKPMATADNPTKRAFEFHEFYWAHHLSNTPSIAVLLWAFWLFRKSAPSGGDLRFYWFAGATILSLLIMSAVTLAVTLALHITGLTGMLWQPGAPTTVQAIVAAVCIGLSLVLMLIFGGRPGLAAITAAYAVFAIPALLFQFFTTGIVISDAFWAPTSIYPVFLSIIVCVGYAVVSGVFLTPYFGDVARYMRPTPSNVIAREDIQQSGVQLLERLHASGRFDRIIVVAHSLGTVVAYDILKTAFARAVGKLNRSEPSLLADPALDAVDRFERPPGSEQDATAVETWRQTWRARVRQLAHAASKVRHSTDGGKEAPVWLVTDFITMGCPLAHAELLLAEGNGRRALTDNFRERRREHELPCCPPRDIGDNRCLTYVDDVTQERGIDHAAVFGFVRWTNLFFRAGRFLATDFIGGALAKRDGFGLGITDICLTERVHPTDARLSHTWYWLTENIAVDAPHLVALRTAANLTDGPACGSRPTPDAGR